MNKLKIVGMNFLRLAKTLVLALLDGKITEEELKEIEQAIMDLLKSKNGNSKTVKNNKKK